MVNNNRLTVTAAYRMISRMGSRNGIWPVRKLSGGMLAWLCVCDEVQICIWPSWCYCHSCSCSSTSRLVLLSCYRLTRIVPDKGLLNGCCCYSLKQNEPASEISSQLNNPTHTGTCRRMKMKWHRWTKCAWGSLSVLVELNS